MTFDDTKKGEGRLNISKSGRTRNYHWLIILIIGIMLTLLSYYVIKGGILGNGMPTPYSIVIVQSPLPLTSNI